MIVKVQRPLYTNAPGYSPPVLIYNKSRTIILRAPFDGKWKAMFAICDNTEKLFFKATLNEKNELDITGRPLNYDPGW